MVRLAASPDTCKYCMFWHILKSCISTFSFSKGWEQISFGSWQQGAGRKEVSEAVGLGHGGGLVASMANVPAVNNLLFFPFFFTSHPPNRCLSVIVMSSSYPSKWFDYKWVTKVAIEPLHSSKLLMCAQIVQCVGVCKKKRAGEKGNEGGKEGGRGRRKRNVKVTLFCLENQKGGQINCRLCLVFWISGNKSVPSYSSRCAYHFERLKNEECSNLYCIYTLVSGKNVNKYTERLQNLPV